MKSLSLLLSACVLAATSYAQQAMNIVHNPIDGNIGRSSVMNATMQARAHKKATANKTTTTSSRWYSYVDYYDASEALATSSIAFSIPYLWGDSSGVFAYSDGSSGISYKNNTMVNMGTVLDPAFSGFNDYTFYNGKMKITSGDAYMLDSLIVWAKYGHNYSKLGVKDTLRITIVSGNGDPSSDIFRRASGNPVVLPRYGVTAPDSLRYLNMKFDSVTNRAVGATTYVKDVILDTSVWGDTTADGIFAAVVGFTPIPVAMGNVVSATFQFISGDPSFTPNDTVFSSAIGYKYNTIRPYVAYRGTTSTPEFAPYSVSNRNEGVFKQLPNFANGWKDIFTPMWFWSSGTPPTGSTLQFPYIDYHLTCATCGTVYDATFVKEVSVATQINVYPDPADDELNIIFNSSVNGSVSVSLTNIVGQTVKSQEVTVVKGQTSKAVFTTRSLANGVYLYHITAEGKSFTGRAMVSH